MGGSCNNCRSAIVKCLMCGECSGKGGGEGGGDGGGGCFGGCCVSGVGGGGGWQEKNQKKTQ